MDFLNKAFTQLADLFRSMTPAARITTGVLLVVVVVSLGYLFRYRVSGPDCDLMNGEPIPYGYMSKMEAAFSSAGLSEYEVRGAHILVPRGQKAAYMAALADADALPPKFGEILARAVNGGSVYESRQAREDRKKVALQAELANIISNMKGVERASVLYATEKKGGLNRQTVTTASVAVKPVGSQGLDPSQVRMIRHFVAGPIPGLKPEAVTVADLAGNGVIHYAGSADGGGSASDNLYFSLKRIYDQEFENKILRALAHIRGVTVTANVELDPERINRVRRVKYEPKPVTVRQYTEESSSSRESGTPGGRPGFVAQAQGNTATALASAQSQGNQETEDDSKSETVSAPNSEQTELEKVGLTPTRVAVAIGIPSSYIEEIWKQRNPTEEGQEPQTPDPAAMQTIEQEQKTKIQQTVAAVLPPVEGVDDPTELVVVNTFPHTPGDEIPAPSVAEKALVWLGHHWGTLGIIGLAGFSLLMLRSMIRAVPSGPRPSPAAASASAEPEEEVEGESAATVTARRLARFAAGGPSLRDELSELVQEDTDAAANILRTWISSTT